MNYYKQLLINFNITNPTEIKDYLKYCFSLMIRGIIYCNANKNQNSPLSIRTELFKRSMNIKYREDIEKIKNKKYIKREEKLKRIFDEK